VKENHGGVHVHPTQNRVLTPRELASLQSFPDDFIFLGSKSNVLKQIGNAVPVRMSNKIAEIVKKGLLNE
jgi:DNA (cytosine-5)-methyltransferase 1